MKCWLVSPGSARKARALVKDGCCAIPWGYVGDLMNFADESAIAYALHEGNSDGYKTVKKATCAARMLCSFRDEIRPGDIVILAADGMKLALSIGVCTSDYEYLTSKDCEEDNVQHSHKVKWLELIAGGKSISQVLLNSAHTELYEGLNRAREAMENLLEVEKEAVGKWLNSARKLTEIEELSQAIASQAPPPKERSKPLKPLTSEHIKKIEASPRIVYQQGNNEWALASKEVIDENEKVLRIDFVEIHIPTIAAAADEKDNSDGLMQFTFLLPQGRILRYYLPAEPPKRKEPEYRWFERQHGRQSEKDTCLAQVDKFKVNGEWEATWLVWVNMYALRDHTRHVNTGQGIEYERYEARLAKGDSVVYRLARTTTVSPVEAPAEPAWEMSRKANSLSLPHEGLKSIGL